MRVSFAVAALAAVIVSGNCLAEDLTAAKAEELLTPLMADDCGTYYTDKGDPDFADVDDKSICKYHPKVTSISTSGSTASASYIHERHFDPALSQAWLNDYNKSLSEGPPSKMFQALNDHLVKWKADGGVDRVYHPAKATFKLGAKGWEVDSAPQ